MSNLCVFCLLLCARTRFEVEIHLTFMACPRDSLFTKIKSVASSARAKRLQWKTALMKCSCSKTSNMDILKSLLNPCLMLLLFGRVIPEAKDMLVSPVKGEKV